MPGRTYLPCASSFRALSPTSSPGSTIPMMHPSVISRSAVTGPEGRTSVPPRILQSIVIMSSNEHRLLDGLFGAADHHIARYHIAIEPLHEQRCHDLPVLVVRRIMRRLPLHDEPSRPPCRLIQGSRVIRRRRRVVLDTDYHQRRVQPASGVNRTIGENFVRRSQRYRTGNALIHIRLHGRRPPLRRRYHDPLTWVDQSALPREYPRPPVHVQFFEECHPLVF